MKIIEPGIKNPPRIYWWEQQDFKCKNCNCVFQIEAEDFVKFEPRRNYDANDIFLFCPNQDCHKTICVSKPKHKSSDHNKAVFEEVFGKGGIFDKIFGSRCISSLDERNK